MANCMDFKRLSVADFIGKSYRDSVDRSDYGVLYFITFTDHSSVRIGFTIDPLNAIATEVRRLRRFGSPKSVYITEKHRNYRQNLCSLLARLGQEISTIPVPCYIEEIIDAARGIECMYEGDEKYVRRRLREKHAEDVAYDNVEIHFNTSDRVYDRASAAATRFLEGNAVHLLRMPAEVVDTLIGAHLLGVFRQDYSKTQSVETSLKYVLAIADALEVGEEAKSRVASAAQFMTTEGILE